MMKIALATLAATALVPVSAAAQTHHAPAGVTWQHPGGGHVAQRHHTAPMKQRFVVHRQGGKHGIGRHHGKNRYKHYRRIDRGFAIPHFWWGPRFHIVNWNQYGFQQPMHGYRWVRYYDDALMVDQYGRVHDGRWGMDWDGYADQWSYDESGVPYYRGDEGYYDVDEYAGGYGHDMPPPPPCGHGCAVPPPPPPPPCAHACGHPGYGYGYGGGYMWIPGGTVTVTETTVHAAAPQQTIVKKVYVKELVKTKPRRSYKKTRPRALPGERG